MKQKKKSLKEIRVGAFIILALVIIIGFVFSIGGQKKLFGGKVRYKIYFDSTGGLFEGDPVMLTGVEIGNVVRLGFPDAIEMKKIMVEIAVLEDVANRIRKDTRARIASASLVYGKLIELSMGSPEEPVIPPGGLIEAQEPTNFSAIVDSTNMMVDDIRKIITKMERGEGLVGMLLNEPLELRQTLHNLAVSSEYLAKLLDRVEKGKSPVGVLLSDSAEFGQSMRNTAFSLDEMTHNLKSTESVLGKLINDPEYGDQVTKDLRSAIHSLASITAKIDSGEGSLGALINDRELYTGLQDVVLGIKRSSLTKWMIQNRRKAGEKYRAKQETVEEPNNQ